MQTLRTNRLVISTLLGIIAIAVLLISFSGTNMVKTKAKAMVYDPYDFQWVPPGLELMQESEDHEMIRYGRDLIMYTSFYLGPKGIVNQISNGLNCQNCHLDAGTKHWANNFSADASTYPRVRSRSGKEESVFKRVNDCFLRSLNSEIGLDNDSREMKAIVAYMNWVGSQVPKDIKPVGNTVELPHMLNRPADPNKGKIIYAQHCSRCHGLNGEGVLNIDSSMYTYPPLWGKNSFTTAAGMHRLSRLAGFVKNNMPFDAPASARFLNDEEAWDVAAFINSMPRPHKIFPDDWPDISAKPYDHPFGPYADSLSAEDHKYGPWN